MNQRVGSRLFVHVIDRCREHGVTRVGWETEPYAVGFYERMGARHLRDGPPSTWGRILPVMGIDVRSGGDRTDSALTGRQPG